MCVAIIVPKGKAFPSMEVLAAAEAQNRDGGGIAWVDGGNVHYRKGLTAEDIFVITEKIKAPAFIHFRISTVGGEIPELCHPFPVTRASSTDLAGTAKAVLMHNGHWGRWRETLLHLQPNNQRIPDGEWSDTRAMAYLSSIYGKNLLSMIDEKVAYLDSRGNITRYGYGWTEIDGCHYSNTHWKSRIDTKSSKKDDNYSHQSDFGGGGRYHGRGTGESTSVTPNPTQTSGAGTVATGNSTKSTALVPTKKCSSKSICGGYCDSHKGKDYSKLSDAQKEFEEVQEFLSIELKQSNQNASESDSASAAGTLKVNEKGNADMLFVSSRLN